MIVLEPLPEIMNDHGLVDVVHLYEIVYVLLKHGLGYLRQLRRRAGYAHVLKTNSTLGPSMGSR